MSAVLKAAIMVTIQSWSQSDHGHNPVDGWYRCGMDITGWLAVWQHGKMVTGSFQAVTIVTPAATLSTYWNDLSFCSRVAGPYLFAVYSVCKGWSLHPPILIALWPWVLWKWGLNYC